MASEASRELFRTQIGDICEQAGTDAPGAFPRWVCQTVLGMTDEGQIDEAVSIGGRNDYGVDIFHAAVDGDEMDQHVCWIQVKYSETLDYRVTRDELESFAGTLRHMRSCPDPANHTFKQKSREFASMEGRNPKLRKKMILVAAGRLDGQAKDLLNNQDWLEDKLGSEYGNTTSLEVYDLDRILSYMTMPNTPVLSIEFDGRVAERRDAETRKKTVMGYVAATTLVGIVKKHREAVFLENLREAPGTSAPTYKAITDTLRDEGTRAKFWRLNNGITATCSSFDVDGESVIRDIENLKIVNGRQTLFTLEKSHYPIDDVYLPMTIHQAVDDDERNLISQATNTQNPIKPVDLITNYREMTDLVSQCRSSFPDFYFERQTKGFAAEGKRTQNRITERRVMRKNDTARAYYAYAIDPNDAMMPDVEMFSATHKSCPYYAVFGDRRIEDLIVPHIFMCAINALHKKWCRELADNPSDDMSRDKGMISKDAVKYYVLHLIHESLLGTDPSVRESIKDGMIGTFRGLGRADPVPDGLVRVAESAYFLFRLCFNNIRRETWPRDLLDKINSKGYEPDAGDVPSPYDVMHALKTDGRRILPQLMRARRDVVAYSGDNVEKRLLELAPRG